MLGDKEASVPCQIGMSASLTRVLRVLWWALWLHGPETWSILIFVGGEVLREEQPTGSHWGKVMPPLPDAGVPMHKLVGGDEGVGEESRDVTAALRPCA